MENGRCFAMAEITGTSAMTRWIMKSFELVGRDGGEYIFKHPNNDVTIIVKTDNIGFLEMIKRKSFKNLLIFTTDEFGEVII